MAVNDKEAIEKMAERLKAQADEVRALEKAIFTDYRNGMEVEAIARKNGCTCKRVKMVINREVR